MSALSRERLKGFDGKNIHFDRVVIATGGMSYPLTGSTGDGYRFARDFGHSLVAPKASLVPLTSPDKVCAELMGLSLKNVSVKFYRDGEKKPVVEDFGEMMFTHFGVADKGTIFLDDFPCLIFIAEFQYVLV